MLTLVLRGTGSRYIGWQHQHKKGEENMKVKYGIIDAEDRQQWLAKISKIQLSPKYAVRIKKMKSQIDNALKGSREVKSELLEEYGTKNPKDGSITVTQKKENEDGYDKWAEFKEKWEELLNTEVEFEPWTVFTEDELEQLDKIELTGEDIEYFDFFGAIAWK